MTALTEIGLSLTIIIIIIIRSITIKEEAKEL
jgi:hypothetical protein